MPDRSSKMSVVGKNPRSEVVVSCFFRTRASFGPAALVVMPWQCLPLCLSLDLYGPRLVAFGPGDKEREHAIVVFGSDAVRIDLNWHRNRPVKSARYALSPVHAGALFGIDGLIARNPDRVLLSLYFEVLPVNSRQFDDGDEVVPLLENVDWGIASIPAVHSPSNRFLDARPELSA